MALAAPVLNPKVQVLTKKNNRNKWDKIVKSYVSDYLLNAQNAGGVSATAVSNGATAGQNIAEIMKKHEDIFIGGNYIIGLFGDETFGEMIDSYKYSCELGLDWASFSVYQFTSKATTEKENLRFDGKNHVPFMCTYYILEKYFLRS